METTRQDALTPVHSEQTPIWTLIIIALCVLILLVWGVQILSIPKVYLMARRHNFLLLYEGHLLVLLSVLLAWFRLLAARTLLWIYQELHRFCAALCMAGILGLEAVLHFFSVPHLEGWWMPMLGGSAFISVAAHWFQKWRKKQRD